MAEKKSREFKRTTVCKYIEGLLERCMIMNSIEGDFSDIRSYRNVKDLTIFGSFVNSDKEKVHDLDVVVELELSDYGKFLGSDEVQHLTSELAPSGSHMLIKYIWGLEGCLRYLKGSSPILSFSADAVENLTGRKVKIIENGEILRDNLQMIFNENNYTPSIFK